jgi:hypothetical protein
MCPISSYNMLLEYYFISSVIGIMGEPCGAYSLLFECHSCLGKRIAALDLQNPRILE